MHYKYYKIAAMLLAAMTAASPVRVMANEVVQPQEISETVYVSDEIVTDDADSRGDVFHEAAAKNETDDEAAQDDDPDPSSPKEAEKESTGEPVEEETVSEIPENETADFAEDNGKDDTENNNQPEENHLAREDGLTEEDGADLSVNEETDAEQNMEQDAENLEAAVAANTETVTTEAKMWQKTAESKTGRQVEIYCGRRH